jgi:molybdopterin/thiamine biosynthesis adenylyltransferase
VLNEEHSYGGYYLQYTLLGIAAAIIYAANVSALLNAVSLFVFTMCVFFVIILIIYSISLRRIVSPVSTEKYVYHSQPLPALESSSVPVKINHEGRYLPQVRYLGIHSQSFINYKHVSVIGIGSVGALVTELLCRAGVGTLTLIDPSRDEHDSVAGSRAGAVEERLKGVNSHTTVQAHLVNLHEQNLQLIECDLVIECTDDFDTKERINRYCIAHAIPWILCSVHGDSGFLKVILKGTPCLTCFEDALDRKPGIATEAISAHLAAALITTEALKVLSHRDPESNLIGFNLSELAIKKIPVSRNRRCITCGPH